MKYLTSLLGKEKNLELALSVKTPASNENGEETAEPDSYIAYENMSNKANAGMISVKSSPKSGLA